MEAAKSTGRDCRLILYFLAPACQSWLLTCCTIQYQKEVKPRGKTLNTCGSKFDDLFGLESYIRWTQLSQTLACFKRIQKSRLPEDDNAFE
jgi:hypothetical protein